MTEVSYRREIPLSLYTPGIKLPCERKQWPQTGRYKGRRTIRPRFGKKKRPKRVVEQLRIVFGFSRGVDRGRKEGKRERATRRMTNLHPPREWLQQSTTTAKLDGFSKLYFPLSLQLFMYSLFVYIRILYYVL